MDKRNQGQTLNLEPDLIQALSLAGGVDAQEPRAGEVCPNCGRGVLDYDGLLNLSCPECGYTSPGCFT
jgi:ribosomal protein S27AE